MYLVDRETGFRESHSVSFSKRRPVQCVESEELIAVDSRSSPTRRPPPQREVAGGQADHKVIFEAVQLIMADQSLTEMCAYSRLVHSAVDAGTTVRETALRILAAA
jgi:hypothetical protein